jgi:hypothetical protein
MKRYDALLTFWIVGFPLILTTVFNAFAVKHDVALTILYFVVAGFLFFVKERKNEQYSHLGYFHPRH